VIIKLPFWVIAAGTDPLVIKLEIWFTVAAIALQLAVNVKVYDVPSIIRTKSSSALVLKLFDTAM
jgi:hypothetical protein